MAWWTRQRITSEQPLEDGARKAGGRQRDPRLRMLALTGLAIGVLGLAIGSAPDVRNAIARLTASPYASHAVQARKQEIDLRFEQAVVMLHAKRYDHAVAALHRLLELAPGMPEAHVNMGYALLGAGNASAARDFFASAVDLRPQQPNAYYGMAVALEALGDLPGAIGAMRTFVHLSPASDPHVRKAGAALWEWEAKRAEGIGTARAAPGTD